ncbi:protein arginine N-methyltransferase 7-like isoform X3 [Dysidea avara]|uniref:protein arginine N-methyltransferase 7-like isoform X3 n=1 Tax=Dysidea avara TaxID=196820 RepID=UPI00332DD9AB
MFAAVVNATTGKMEWEKVGEDDDSDISGDLARSQYGDMLLDAERNQAYYKALQYAVDITRRQNKEPIVLDIGTGTGLLAMMAAKCGAKKIYACEVLKPMAKIATEVISQNSYGDIIKVIPLRSTDLVVEKGGVMEEKANILVTEVFDTELVGEGVLSTMEHAQQNLLEPDAIIIPSSAKVYLQIFHSQHLWSSHKLDPINFPPGVITVPESWQKCAGAASLWDLHVEELGSDQIVYLSDPQFALEFSFTKLPVTSPQHCEVNITQTGVCHGVVMWWELSLCPNVNLSTSPWNRTQWRDHWLQGVQFLPTALKVEGNKVFVKTFNDDYSMWFTIDTVSRTPTSDDMVERPLCTCGTHAVWNRSRMSMLNDSHRNGVYYQVLSKYVSRCNTVLCVSDVSLLPLFLIKLGFKKVFILENVSPLSTQVMNEIIRTNDAERYIKVIPRAYEDLSLIDSDGLKIDVIVGEPYFSSTLLPWHNLHFWYARTYVNHLLDNNAVVVPIKADLLAIAVQFDNLHRLRSKISTIEGFDLSAYQSNIEQDNDSCDPEPYSLWEYPCVACSDVHKIFEFDFTDPINFSALFENSGNISLVKSGANAVVFWMEYYLDQSTKFSEGLVKTPVVGDKLHWNHKFKQAVKLLPKGCDKDVSSISFKFTFSSKSGDVHIYT